LFRRPEGIHTPDEQKKANEFFHKIILAIGIGKGMNRR
jgi:hypothetical protein